MDTLVLDIETKNTFGELGGNNRSSLNKMEISVCCVYSYASNTYTCFDENQFDALKKLLSERATLVGFSANKFDFPILSRTLNLNLTDQPRIDLSDEIERESGRLIGLNALAGANLGIQKLSTGLAAPVLYKAGKMDELKKYCEQDVKITKDLYDLVKKQGWLLIPDRESDTPVKLELHLPSALDTLF